MIPPEASQTRVSLTGTRKEATPYLVYPFPIPFLDEGWQVPT